jgi:hypothetical protein
MSGRKPSISGGGRMIAGDDRASLDLDMNRLSSDKKRRRGPAHGDDHP